MHRIALGVSTFLIPFSADASLIEGEYSCKSTAIDMAYTKFAISNSYKIGISLNEMKKDYPNAHIVPLLRGWIVGKRDLTLISGLKADVNIAKSFSKDWGIFTYESLLIQSGRSLSEILKEVE